MYSVYSMNINFQELSLLLEYGNVQWTEKNLITMLRIIKEWKLLCHDSVEVEIMLGNKQPLWGEVASSISDHYKLDPVKCYTRFTQVMTVQYCFGFICIQLNLLQHVLNSFLYNTPYNLPFNVTSVDIY